MFIEWAQSCLLEKKTNTAHTVHWNHEKRVLERGRGQKITAFVGYTKSSLNFISSFCNFKQSSV